MHMPHVPIRAVALACLLFAGCDAGAVRRGSPTYPSLAVAAVPVPPPGPPAVPTNTVQDIALGDRVEGRYTYCFGSWCTRPDGEKHFVFTAPTDGTVLVTLTWPSVVGAIFKLTLDGVVVPPRPGVWSPLTGELRVIAGTRYTIVVSLGGADEQFEDHPFVLSTEMR
jgi:hypothetical protein